MSSVLLQSISPHTVVLSICYQMFKQLWPVLASNIFRPVGFYTALLTLQHVQCCYSVWLKKLASICCFWLIAYFNLSAAPQDQQYAVFLCTSLKHFSYAQCPCMFAYCKLALTPAQTMHAWCMARVSKQKAFERYHSGRDCKRAWDSMVDRYQGSYKYEER